MNSQNQKQLITWQESLISSLDVGVVVINQNFEVEAWNQFMVNHTGSELEEVLNNSLFSAASEIDEKWFRNKCRAVFELQTPVFIIWEQQEYLFEMKVARPITSPVENMYQNVTILPIVNNDGNVTKVCILVYDVTDQALAKIRIQGLNQQLKQISRIDGLTGLYNRRFWQERFELEYKLTFRTRSPISIIILDIDHFKRVNDNYGHQAGDTVIKTVAKIIMEQTRETDMSGRFGGEEFVSILPDTTKDNARILAERIRVAAENKLIQYEMFEIKVTLSVGVAEFDEQYTTPSQWLEAADKALYTAKNSGRNQTVIA